MLLRPDFLNLTVCVVGIYMMFNIDVITKTKFRLLVAGIFLSLVFDFIWLFLKHTEYSQTLDGEAGVRQFSLSLSYISFILRVSFINLILSVASGDGRVLERLTRLRTHHSKPGCPPNRKQSARGRRQATQSCQPRRQKRFP